MKQKTKNIAWLVIGILLASAPVWGLFWTAAGMMLTFNDIQNGIATKPEYVAPHISMALHATFIGMLACPIGIIIAVITAIRMGRASKTSEGKQDCVQQHAGGLR